MSMDELANGHAFASMARDYAFEIHVDFLLSAYCSVLPNVRKAKGHTRHR